MILSMIALMVGHVVEIWLFAATLLAMSRLQWFGGFAGAFDGGFGDFLYFSAVNYTSLGYGDIHPIGSMRAVAVTEALTGLMMIGWSASFTYLKMEQIWQTRASVRRPKRSISTDGVLPVAAPDPTNDRDT